MVKLPVSAPTAVRSRSGSSIQPSRQPVMHQYLENEFTTIASRDVRHAQSTGSPNVMPW